MLCHFEKKKSFQTLCWKNNRIPSYGDEMKHNRLLFFEKIDFFSFSGWFLSVGFEVCHSDLSIWVISSFRENGWKIHFWKCENLWWKFYPKDELIGFLHWWPLPPLACFAWFWGLIDSLPSNHRFFPSQLPFASRESDSSSFLSQFLIHPTGQPHFKILCWTSAPYISHQRRQTCPTSLFEPQPFESFLWETPRPHWSCHKSWLSMGP